MTMVKLFCQLALLAATATTMLVAPVSAVGECCQCDHANNLYDIIRMEQQENNNNDGKNNNSNTNNNEPKDNMTTDNNNRRGIRGRRVRGLRQNTDEMGDGMPPDLGDVMLPECCPCPSKLLVVAEEEDNCLSSRASKGEEEFCLGIPVSLIGAGSDLLINNNIDGGDVDEHGLVRIVTTRDDLEKRALIHQVGILAEICREGENLPGDEGKEVLEAVRVATEKMKVTVNMPPQWQPIVIANTSPDNATARSRLLDLVRNLENGVFITTFVGERNRSEGFLEGVKGGFREQGVAEQKPVEMDAVP